MSQKGDFVEYLKKGQNEPKIQGTELGESDFYNHLANRINYTFSLKENPITEIDLLKMAVSGKGHEGEKITQAHSSSLQAFMIFRKVKEGNPIRIDNIKYDQVLFEVQHKAIGYDSYIDVALKNDNGDVLFIESKLFEVVRDSKKEGSFVVGPSYFSKHENGYQEKLKFSFDDLKEIGIDFPLESKMYGENASAIKKEIIQKSENKDGYSKINALPEGKWVYSYGIKQILSHVIGILNCEEYEKTPKKVRFAYLYNKLPGYEKNDAQNKLNDYIKHIKKVYEKLKERNPELENLLSNPILTYQGLYNDERNKIYFNSVGEMVCQYYQLDKKDP